MAVRALAPDGARAAEYLSRRENPYCPERDGDPEDGLCHREDLEVVNLHEVSNSFMSNLKVRGKTTRKGGRGRKTKGPTYRPQNTKELGGKLVPEDNGGLRQHAGRKGKLPPADVEPERGLVEDAGHGVGEPEEGGPPEGEGHDQPEDVRRVGVRAEDRAGVYP